ncbi:MAG: hypothetical protein QOE68_4636, partial [Thermoanaerobaculia bacterium]|nr:hypothetical protein [Thermoanaerobaculia bacterium]
MKFSDLQVVRPIPPDTSPAAAITNRFIRLARLYATVAVKASLALVALAGIVTILVGIPPEKFATHYSDLLVVLGFTAVPLSMLAAAILMGWLHRRSLKRRMRHTEDRVAPLYVAPSQQAPQPAINGDDNVPETPQDAGKEAERVHVKVQRAYTLAWLGYASIITVFIIAYTNRGMQWDGRIAIAYTALAPQILILTWSLRLTHRWRLLAFVVYGFVGSMVLAFFSNRAWHVAASVIGPFALFPMAGLLFLFVRRIQPFVVLLVASVLWFVGLGVLLDHFRPAVTIGSRHALETNPWLIAAGLLNIILGVVLTTWLLQRRWPLRVAGIAVALTGTVLLGFDLVYQRLPIAIQVICFVAVAVLQIFILWALFKLFVWFQERGFLTNELLQIHLCWVFLTLYYEGSATANTLYTDQFAVRWGFLLALVLFIATLHMSLFLIRRSRPRCARKRLLVLRAFGRADEREDLLDDLHDTWRRIGAIDLIAATDVASRTLQSTMLEAFLLRRSDEEFLHNEADVKERLERRRSEIEADARYPV